MNLKEFREKYYGRVWREERNGKMMLITISKKKLKGTRTDILLLSIEVTGTNPVSKKFPLWVFR